MGVPRCVCGRPLVLISREEIETVARDPGKAGVGSSYAAADSAGMLFIPPIGQTRLPPGVRRLFRLCSFQVPKCELVYLRHLGLYLTIRETFPVTNENPDLAFVAVTEREVVSPGWSFQDGNVSFHVRRFDGIPREEKSASALVPAPGLSTTYFDGPAAELVQPGTTVPLGGGKVPGTPVGGALGFMRSLPFRYPQEGGPDLAVPIQGPTIIVVYASVLQTDPSSRPQRPNPGLGGTPLDGERPEDAFVRTHSNVVYGHVGARIVYERESYLRCALCGTCPACCACKKGGDGELGPHPEPDEPDVLAERDA